MDSPQDESFLEKMGYKQEMRRSRGLFHILFMTLAIMAVPYGLAAPIATGLVSGGPAAIFWGWVLVSIFVQTLALSLAEISSKYPTSAGAPYYCFRLASPKRRVLFSWINGWLTMVGVWTISLSVTFGTAQLIVAVIGIFQPDFVAAPWQTYLIFVGVSLVPSFFCLFLNHTLPALDILSAFWTLLGTIVILVAVSARAASGRRDASFVFVHYDASLAGWTPGWSFFVGLVPQAYTYSAIGMIASMAEEVRNPSINVPRAIVWSIPVGFLTGILFLLPLLFTLPDVGTLLAVSGGQPIALMFELMMGSKAGGFGMWFIVFGVAMFCSISISCAASRATYAFSRDKALPFHSTFAHVNYLQVPLNAFVLSTAIQLLLGLLFLGSSTAFNAFVGIAALSLGTSYAMPIAISLCNGRRDMSDAPFSLGKAGFILNIIAILWVMFEVVMLSMPTVIPVTRVTMNYASPVFVGFAVISAVWYLINGRFHYHGPAASVQTSEASHVEG